MSEHIRELADSLEEYGTTRADFRDTTAGQRYVIARWLVIARSQVNASNAPTDTQQSGAYTTQLIEKKNRYFHACGRAGIEMKEVKAIWWEVVYDGAAPHRRSSLV